MPGDPPPREAARVVLLDAAGRVLLLRVVDPSDGRTWWQTPGGGLGPGEEPAAGALRELREETGIADADLVREIWVRRYRFRFDGRGVDQQERFYLARARGTAVAGAGRMPDEVGVLVEHRWWSAAAIAGSRDLFSPADLGALLAPLARGEIPAAPLVLGAGPGVQT